MRRSCVLSAFIGAIVKTALVALIYGGIGLAVTVATATVAGAHGPWAGVTCTGQTLPWASTYLCWEGGAYTKVWNTRTLSWGPYYPMAAPVPAQAATIIVVPDRHHGYCDDPIRSFKRMMREFERFGRSHHRYDRRHWRHHRSYRHHRHC